MSTQSVVEWSLEKIRIPTTTTSKVWKEECAFSYHTQESEGGVLVDLHSWVAFSPSFAKLNFQKTGQKIYLNIKKERILKKAEPKEPPTERPKVLGIGVEGGFQTEEDKWEPVYTYNIVVLPNFEYIPITELTIPEKVKEAVDAIIKIDSAEKKESVKAWVADGKILKSQVCENLVQLQNGRQIPSSNWKCDVCRGDSTTNLWLNLTDGHIGCGRKNWDGSGGNGHALDHYKETGFPLVVKLGTITPEGADVFSYPEDNMVLDPYLEKHLLHWGLDMKTLTKTDKTVAELEIELQHNFDWSRAQEKAATLIPVYGPGFTGIQNLGNTCYMASTLQVLFKIPQFIDLYHKQFETIIQSTNFNEAPRDFHAQIAKFARSLCSGEFSKPPDDADDEEQKKKGELRRTIRPFMLKTLIGEGHADFSTNRQQDAFEFFQYFLQLVQRGEHAKRRDDPTIVFRFSLEQRLQCSSSGAVRYSKTDKHNSILLPIPLEAAVNKEEVSAYEKRQQSKTEEEKKAEREKGTAEDPVWPRIPLSSCFERWSAKEIIDGWYSPVTKSKSIAFSQKRFASFPQYLVLQMGRFYIQGNKYGKLEVFIDAPDELNLEYLRGKGMQPGEVELPSEEEKIQLNEDVISNLMAMGFPRTRCEHAAYNNQGKSVEVAMEWLFAHMDDPALDKPLSVSKKQSQSSTKPVDENSVEQLINMGFDRPRCINALNSTDNNFERALDWLFSHPGDEPPPSAQKTSAPSAEQNTEPGNYKLKAFITHMGKSTESGHYVAHINVEGRWIIYNDLKVAISQSPPKDMAYIYFYERV